MRKSMLVLFMFVAIATSGCAKIGAKIVEPGKAYSTQEYGVCFPAKDIKKLNRHCNIEIVN